MKYFLHILHDHFWGTYKTFCGWLVKTETIDLHKRNILKHWLLSLFCISSDMTNISGFIITNVGRKAVTQHVFLPVWFTLYLPLFFFSWWDEKRKSNLDVSPQTTIRADQLRPVVSRIWVCSCIEETRWGDTEWPACLCRGVYKTRREILGSEIIRQ